MLDTCEGEMGGEEGIGEGKVLTERKEGDAWRGKVRKNGEKGRRVKAGMVQEGKEKCREKS